MERTISASYNLHNSIFQEKGRVFNGWSRVKLADHRYTYVKTIDGKDVYMKPDSSCFDANGQRIKQPENPASYLANVFESAEEFIQRSAIVKRGKQVALLGADGHYIVPFEYPPYGQTVSSLFTKLNGGDCLVYQQWWRLVNTNETIKSIERIYNRDGLLLYEGVSHRLLFDNDSIIICKGEDRMRVDSKTARVIFPFCVSHFDIEDRKMLTYSTAPKAGWNVFDSISEKLVFREPHQSIVYLEKRKCFLVIDDRIKVANEKGTTIRELPGSLDTLYSEQYFKGDCVFFDFDGTPIIDSSYDRITVLFSNDESETAISWFSQQNKKEYPRRPPYRKEACGAVSYLECIKDDNHFILDLNGSVLLGPLNDSIEPYYEFGNRIEGFKVKSNGYHKWHVYSLTGEYLEERIIDYPFNEIDYGYDFYSHLGDDIVGCELSIDDNEPYDFFEGHPLEYQTRLPQKQVLASDRPITVLPDKRDIRYLFFDTETTGVPKDYNAPITDLENWPRLVQLSWVISDSSGKELKVKDYIIKPEGFSIPNDAARIHGITTELAQREGVLLQRILGEFIQDLNSVDILVGHNIDFDKKIIEAEFIRQNKDGKVLSKPSICTMKSSTDYCRLPGKYGYKWPTLQELHKKLFGVNFEDAHNSLNDIKATKDCFFELKARKIIK